MLERHLYRSPSPRRQRASARRRFRHGRCAAVVVLEHGTVQEHALVLAGHLPLLEAANQARLRRQIPVDDAILAWRSWSPEQRIQFGRGAGISEIWDCAISPIITEQRARRCHD